MEDSLIFYNVLSLIFYHLFLNIFFISIQRFLFNLYILNSKRFKVRLTLKTRNDN